MSEEDEYIYVVMHRYASTNVLTGEIKTYSLVHQAYQSEIAAAKIIEGWKKDGIGPNADRSPHYWISRVKFNT